MLFKASGKFDYNYHNSLRASCHHASVLLHGNVPLLVNFTKDVTFGTLDASSMNDYNTCYMNYLMKGLASCGMIIDNHQQYVLTVTIFDCGNVAKGLT